MADILFGFRMVGSWFLTAILKQFRSKLILTIGLLNVFNIRAPHCKFIFRENICYYRNLPQILERKVYAAFSGFYHRYLIYIRYLWFFPSVSEKRRTYGRKLWLDKQQSVQQITKFSSPHPHPPFKMNFLSWRNIYRLKSFMKCCKEKDFLLFSISIETTHLF